MIKNQTPPKFTIDLDGPDGNAYALIAYARRFSNIIEGCDFNSISAEMTSGDYKNLVSVFNKYFGKFVNLSGNTILSATPKLKT
jgi:hypothetical protein